LTQVTFKAGDVFDELRNRAEQRERYGMVILDPPSFTKSKKTVASALHGYRTINTLALKLLEPDGILVSASCSHHIGREEFIDMVRESALKAGRGIQMLEFRGASPDHPVLPSMPETAYLKFALFAVT
jgi:23S rRNA (cytosine1962-C5)-methyltransferase